MCVPGVCGNWKGLDCVTIIHEVRFAEAVRFEWESCVIARKAVTVLNPTANDCVMEII